MTAPESERIYDFDELLRCDEANVTQAKKILLEFHRDSLDAVDECHKLFKTIGILFGKSSGYDDYQDRWNEWLKTRRGTVDENVRFLEQATLIGQVDGLDPAADAKEAITGGNSVIARIYLLLRLGRDFFFGFTDLLRRRLTSMQGYLRIQAETAAILVLCGKNSSVAVDWLNKEGKEFYYKHHKNVVHELRELGLYRYYEEGSNLALHSRPLGLAGGIIEGKKKAAPGEVRLSYQELHDPIEVFTWFYVYLRAHKEIIETLPKALPEVDFTQVDIKHYGAMVETLWATLFPLYTRKRGVHLPRS